MRLLLVLWVLVFFGMDVAKAQDDDARIWRVHYQGNLSFTDIVLAEVVAAEPVNFTRRLLFWTRSGQPLLDAEVRRDEIRLERFYQRRGFPDAHVRATVTTGNTSWRREITFRVIEGTPIRIETVICVFEADDAVRERIESDRTFQRALRQNPMREGSRYQPIRQPEAEGLFLNTLRNLGYVFARVQLTIAVDSTTYQARAVFTLDPGPLAYINEISVEGNASVSEDLVRLESGLRTGQRYDQRRLTRAQQEIFSHHLFRFVTISVPEQPRDTTVDLRIRVRENALRSIHVQLGAGTEEYARAGVSWQHRNPFGNAHSFSASSRVSFIEQRANLDYLVPYVFNTSSSYVLSPFGQRLNERNFLLYRAGATNSFVYQYSRQLAGTISYEFTINEEVLRNRSVVLRDSTQLYNQSVLRFSGFYNEFSFDRGEGWAVRPFFEISGIFNTGTLNYQRASLDVRRFIDFSSRTQLALRVDTGVLFADDADRLPANILYYLGGTNSVRGWSRWELGPKRASLSEQGDFEGYVPIGGRVNMAFNSEIRQDIGFIARGFGLAMFFDGGQIWRTRAEANLNDLQFGVGGGLRYRSPVGPVRLDIGYKLNPTDEDLDRYNARDYGGVLARWGIHFSIGQAF